MRIGIIGASTVGITLATRLSEIGHEVMVANSRERESLKQRLASIDARITAASVSEASDSDVVFLAVPWLKVREVLRPDKDWEGRVLVDATNIFLSYAPDFRIDDLKGDSGSEVIARLAPSARTVKAFNTLPFEKIFAPHDLRFKRVLFVAGDDNSAVATIGQLIAELDLCPIPLGSLAIAGRLMELNGPLSGVELFSPT